MTEVETMGAAEPIVAEAKEEAELTVAQQREAKITESVLDSGRKKLSIVPYVPASDCPELGTGIPLKLAYSTIYSLNSLEEKLGMTATEYVREKLHYNSRLYVCDAFAAEQVDALALAIYQIERGKAFILGDFAGIGKGRVNAGLLRYAYHNGYIPVFFTKGENLFTDIYNDFYDIGGFDNNIPTPNNLPKPFIINGGSNIMSPIDKEDTVIFSAYERAKTIEICADNKVPKSHKLILCTYSQISGEVEKVKDKNKKTIIEFFVKIAPKALFVLDESHSASGEKSWIGTHFKRILEAAKACSFSSATYAKSPQTMRFYAAKTDLIDSPVSMDSIVEAASQNGEVIQEYIANKLVRNGQMIRRERSYDGCDINSSFVGLGEEAKLKYFAIYDHMIMAFNKIHEEKISEYLNKAIKLACEHHAKEQKIKLVWKPPFEDKTEKEDWESRNAKNFTAQFLNSETTGSGRSQWIEALLFSLKADFVADTAILSMRTQYDVEYVEAGETSMKKTSRKPVIFLKSTGDALLLRLGYNAGRVLSREEGDFSQTLVDLVTRLVVANLRFARVDGNASSLIMLEDIDITEFLEDKGEHITQVKEEFRKQIAGIPLSPIDHMIDKIEKAARASHDTGYSSSPTYIVEDTTKRKIRILQREDGRYDVLNKISESATRKLARFNNGSSDVVIINAAASTGVSIHAKSTFVDKRQRVALIHQVELDVNTEVQKRGRINRSGQVCKPAYRYVVTVIPSETRRLISLARKLRSLDANTSGNMRQSAKMSSFIGSDGKPIEDIFNRYGYQALTEFIALTENDYFKILFERYAAETKRFNGNEEEKLKAFTGKIETVLCEQQEKFYEGINSIYLEIRKRNEENDTWDLDIDIVDLRAATRTKKVLMKGEGKSIFGGDVYFEDKYTSVIVKTLPKDLVESAATKLALKLDPSTTDKNKAQNTFEETYKKYIEYAVSLHLNAIPVPDRRDYSKGKDGTADYNTAVEQYEFKRKQLEDEIRAEKNAVMNMLLTFAPMQPTMVYTDVMGAKSYIDKYISDLKADHSVPDTKEFHRDFAVNFQSSPARFLGVKVYAANNESLISSSIAFVFAPLNTKADLIEINPTELGIWILKFILRTNEWTLAQKLPIINEWKISGRLRENTRILTGDLLSALSISEEIISNASDIYAPRKAILQFTNADGTTDSGIRLFPKSGTKFEPIVAEKKIDLNAKEFREYLRNNPNKRVVVGNNFFMYDKRKYEVKYTVAVSDEEGKYKSPYNNQKLLKKIEDENSFKFESKSITVQLPSDTEEQAHSFHYASEVSKDYMDDVLAALYRHSAASLIVDEAQDVAQITPVNSDEYISSIMSEKAEDKNLFFKKGDFTRRESDDGITYLFLTITPKNRASKYASGDMLSQLVKILGTQENVSEYIIYPNTNKNIKANLYRWPLNEDKAKRVFNIIFSIDKTYRPLPSSSYVVYKQEDVTGESGDKREQAGEYRYILERPLSADNKHPDFIRHENMKGTPYGVAVVAYILSAVECSQFKYIPYNISVATALQNLNGVLFSDENKQELYTFAQENKENPSAVGRKAMALTKINMNYIFGGNSIENVGRIIISDYIPMKESGSKERSDTKAEAKEVQPISLKGLRDAEDYLLKIKQLI